MSKVGVPGHCWGLDGSEWHAPGKCLALDCDRQCCEPDPLFGVVQARRDMLLSQVAQLFEDHGEYKQVVFHREVLGDSEIITAVFLSAAGYELGQYVLNES